MALMMIIPNFGAVPAARSVEPVMRFESSLREPLRGFEAFYAQ